MNPRRVTAQVQNSNDTDCRLDVLIIHAERKTRGEHAIAAKMLWMNPMEVGELFRVGNQGANAVISDPCLLAVIKVARVLQILYCFRQQNDRLHDSLENRRLTSS